MEILKYINDVNILLVVLDILFLIISFLFLNKRKVSSRVKDVFVICYTLINLFLFSYFNSMFQGIFTLKYLSVRTYLILVLISLLIFLYTFNKKVKLGYKLVNYLMTVLISIILIINIYVVVSEKVGMYNIMDISNSIILMNISYIIFGIYLGIISFVYIGYYIYYDVYLIKKIPNVKEEVLEDKLKKESKIKGVLNKAKIDIKKKSNEKGKVINKKKKVKEKEVLKSVSNNNIDNKENSSLESLLNYKVGESFYIKGVDCSIIFCDSNKENIVRNYDILSHDINAKLVNGYTLSENIMIKDICDKLNVSNLGNVDIDNLGLLNVINVDEYMFLKKILSGN